MARITESIEILSIEILVIHSPVPNVPGPRRPFMAADLCNNNIPLLDNLKKDAAKILNWLSRLETLFDQRSMIEDAEKGETKSIGLTGIKFGNRYRTQHTALLEGSWTNYYALFNKCWLLTGRLIQWVRFDIKNGRLRIVHGLLGTR